MIEYPPDEIAIRFHHKLVWIHPFPNGNGRHARLMADLLAKKVLGRPPFSWGGGPLERAGDTRSKYLDALYKADHYEFGPLLSGGITESCGWSDGKERRIILEVGRNSWKSRKGYARWNRVRYRPSVCQ